MKVKIQVTIESEGKTITDQVACLQRNDLSDETLGLTLAEAKELLASVQEKMVKYQTEEYIQQQRNCPECSKVRSQKGQHDIVYRSLFGKLKLHSPRLYNCSCQPQSQRSFSPLAECLSERTYNTPQKLGTLLRWITVRKMNG